MQTRESMASAASFMSAAQAGQLPNLEELTHEETITSISFNEMQDAFVIGTTKGFSTYTLDPLMFRVKRPIEGGVKVAHLVAKTNLFLIITSGSDPNLPSNMVYFWDDRTIRFSGKINLFQGDPLCLSYCSHVITVAEQGKLYCLKINPLEPFENISMTTDGALEGLHQIAAVGNELCVATCRDQVGFVDLTWFNRHASEATEIKNIASTQSSQQNQTPYSSTDSVVIQKGASLTVEAHENALAFMALNHDCTMLATASVQGTLIRIFDPRTGKKMSEFRRGSTPTKICHLSFDRDNKYLVCCSDKGTIHIFKVGHLLEQGASSGNTTSYFSALSNLVSIAGSEWSFAQFKLNPEQVSASEIKAIVLREDLHIVSKKGWHILVPITEAGGTLTDFTQTPLLHE